MFKKYVFKICITFMLCLCLIFACMPAWAYEVVDVVSLSNCASTYCWKAKQGQTVNSDLFSLDNVNFTTSPASIKLKVDTNNNSEEFNLRPNNKIDALTNDILSFDIYVSDKSAFNSIVGNVYISSSGTREKNTLCWSFANVKLQVNNIGWNTINLNFSKGRLINGKVDYSAISYFSIKFDEQSKMVANELNIDNICFTSSSGNKKYLHDTSYKCGDNIEVEDEVIYYGDTDGDTMIKASDALSVLQYAVDKIYFSSTQLRNADVDINGKINATDALCVLQKSVNKITEFPDSPLRKTQNTITSNDYMSQININGTRLVTPYYGSSKSIVAVCDVIYYGAVGDGITDDTKAFILALNAAKAAGGGVVFVPVGTYKITSELSIPDGVTLRGDAPDEPEVGKPKGTIINSYVGVGKENGPSLFSVRAGSGLKNMAIYYPEQTMDNIKPCSYTIKEKDQYGPTVESVLLVNSYNGIAYGPEVNALQYVRNVYGTVLKNGIYNDYNVDIFRAENVNFSPEYWLNCGLGQTVDEQALRSFVRNNCTAIISERVDWTYFTDINIDGAYIGFQMSNSQTVGGAPNGQMYNLKFTNCKYGIYGLMTNSIGHMFTNGYIEADYPVYLTETLTNSVTFNNCQLVSLLGECITQKSGYATFTDCSFESKNNDVSLVYPIKGELSLINCQFSGGKYDISCELTSNVKAINCATEDTIRLGSSSYRVSLYYGEYETETIDTNAYDYERVERTKPLGNVFVDVSNSDYGIYPNTDEDIAVRLQAAIDDVYSMGGGVVYIPAGKYNLDTPITIKTGVELQGPCNTSHHSHVPTAMLYTDWGMGKDSTYAALIQIESQAGIQGFNVMYKSQYCTSSTYDGVEKYSYTVMVNGFDSWIVNVLFTNSRYGVDLFSNRCDCHYVEGITGTPLNNGIKVGGGSANGIVRDIQYNIHYWTDNPIYNLGQNCTYELDYVMRHNQSIILSDTVNEIFYNNFMLGAYMGLKVEGTVKNGFVLAHGSDCANYSCYLSGNSECDVKFVNSQFVCANGQKMEYVHADDQNDGDYCFISTNFWGAPTNCYYQGGGNIRFYSGTVLACGTNGFQVFNGQLKKVGIISRQTNVQYDFYADNNATKLEAFGNIYGKTLKAYDKLGVCSGTDFTEGKVINGDSGIVTFNACENTDGWLSTGKVIEADTKNVVEGQKCIISKYDFTSNSLFLIQCALAEPVDIGSNNVLKFDFYVSDAKLMYNGLGQIEISSSGKPDDAELSNNILVFSSNLEDGWNSVTIPLSSLGFNSTTQNIFDSSKCNFFRMYINDMQSNETNFVVRIDNIRFETVNMQ